MPAILIVAGDQRIGAYIGSLLRDTRMRILSAEDANAGKALLAANYTDVVVADTQSCDPNSPLLRHLTTHQLNIPVIQIHAGDSLHEHCEGHGTTRLSLHPPGLPADDNSLAQPNPQGIDPVLQENEDRRAFISAIRSAYLHRMNALQSSTRFPLNPMTGGDRCETAKLNARCLRFLARLPR